MDLKLNLSMLEARAPRARAQEAADMPVLDGCELAKGAFALPDVADVSCCRGVPVSLSLVVLLFFFRKRAPARLRAPSARAHARCLGLGHTDPSPS